MKHLQPYFESFERPLDRHTSISYREYDAAPRSLDPFTAGELAVIRKFCRTYSLYERKLEWKHSVDPTTQLASVEVRNCQNHMRYRITKDADEYYYVTFPHSFYYRCDGIEGLLAFLKYYVLRK